MKKLPILYDGDTVYFKDGRVGTFLKKTELSDYDEKDNIFFDIIQMVYTDEYLIYNMIDPEEILYFVMFTQNEKFLDSVIRLMIGLSVRELGGEFHV